jgi:hypothetical protein
LAHSVISLRCGIWSLSGHSGHRASRHAPLGLNSFAVTLVANQTTVDVIGYGAVPYTPLSSSLRLGSRYATAIRIGFDQHTGRFSLLGGGGRFGNCRNSFTNSRRSLT